MPQTTALARFDPKRFSGPQTDAAVASALMREAAENWNFISPAPSVAAIPDGCALAFSSTVIDAKHDTYPIPGGSKVGLGKPALDRLKGALGVKPIPQQCGQVDDGSDPWYVHYVWNGYYRDLDGTIVPLIGEKKLDLREGSALVHNLRRIAAKKGRDATDEIAQMRAFILEHAATKARLRAIRSLGIKTSYEPVELAKPFVAVRLAFTGAFQDPEARAHYQRRMTDSFLDDSVAAFGGRALPAPGSATPATALPDAAPVRRLPPPPVGEVPAEPDDVDAASAAQSAPGAQGRGAPMSDQVRHAEGSDQVRMPGKKGGTVAEADYDDLVYWRGKIAQGLEADPNGKYAANNRKQLAMIEAELAARDDTSAPDDDSTAQGSSGTVPQSGAGVGGSAPAETPGPARSGHVVPQGFPGAGKPIEELSGDTLRDLRSSVQGLIEQQEKLRAPPERLAKAREFLGAVELQMDLLRRSASKPAAEQSDEEWFAGYDAAGGKS